MSRKLEAQIDQLVYELTEEEINIVEEKNKI